MTPFCFGLVRIKMPLLMCMPLHGCLLNIIFPATRDRKRGHYKRGLFTEGISEISEFSRISTIRSVPTTPDPNTSANAKRWAYFCKSIVIVMGGVSRYFSQVLGSGVNLTLPIQNGQNLPCFPESGGSLESPDSLNSLENWLFWKDPFS